jgi:hypothetical protein
VLSALKRGHNLLRRKRAQTGGTIDDGVGNIALGSLAGLGLAGAADAAKLRPSLMQRLPKALKKPLPLQLGHLPQRENRFHEPSVLYKARGDLVRQTVLYESLVIMVRERLIGILAIGRAHVTYLCALNDLDNVGSVARA